MPKFKDPKTGQVVNVNSFLVFLSSFLFGLFFFLYIGEVQHALVMVGFAILIALVGIFIDPIYMLFGYVFPLIYSFIAPKIVKDKWLNKGYEEVENKESNNTLLPNLSLVATALLGNGLILFLFAFILPSPMMGIILVLVVITGISSLSKSIMSLLSLPINNLSLGVFLLITNIICIFLLSIFMFYTFIELIIMSVVLTLFNIFINSYLAKRRA